MRTNKTKIARGKLRAEILREISQAIADAQSAGYSKPLDLALGVRARLDSAGFRIQRKPGGR